MAKELRADIEAARAKLKIKVGGGREFARLPDHLHDGETVEAVAVGKYSGDLGIVALTDRRVIFFVSQLVGKERTEDFPLSKVSTVNWSKKRMKLTDTGQIEIAGSGFAVAIEGVASVDGEAMVRAIRERLAAPVAPASTGSVDVADQIKKLADLRDAGVLTDAEFDAKKQELLGRI